MTIITRLGIPIAAVTIACTAVIGAPQAFAATTCQYQVLRQFDVFVRSAPTPSAPTIDRIPGGTAGPGSAAVTNGYRTFHGGWVQAIYLIQIPGTCS